MITIVWRTTDDRVFESEVEANRHQGRIALKALLLEAPMEEQGGGDKEGAIGRFAERLTEWMLSDPTRTAILEVLQADNLDVPQLGRSAEGKTAAQRTIGPASGAGKGGITGDAVRGLRTAEEQRLGLSEIGQPALLQLVNCKGQCRSGRRSATQLVFFIIAVPLQLITIPRNR